MSLHRPRMLFIDVGIYTKRIFLCLAACTYVYHYITTNHTCVTGMLYTPYAGMYIIFTIQYLLQYECVDSYNYTFVRGQRSYSPVAAWKYVFYYYCLIEKTKWNHDHRDTQRRSCNQIFIWYLLCYIYATGAAVFHGQYWLLHYIITLVPTYYNIRTHAPHIVPI